jgi:hypothetical protein
MASRFGLIQSIRYRYSFLSRLAVDIAKGNLSKEWCAMRTIWLSLCACFLATTSLIAQERHAQVQLDVVVLSGPAAMLDSPELKSRLQESPAKGPIACSMENSAVMDLLRDCRKHGAKLLATPKLVTQSGKPASFLTGGQVAVPIPPAPDGTPAFEYRNVGNELTIMPEIRKDGSMYLEVKQVIRAEDRSRNVQMKYGLVPGFEEQSARFAAELKQGRTFVGCVAGGEKVLLVAITPNVIDLPKTMEDRTAAVAAKLVRKYREAVAKGDKELAREFAQMALDLDPCCFAVASEANVSDGATHGRSKPSDPMLR